MKLRREVLVASALATGVTWIWLDARSPRCSSGRILARTAVEAADDPAPELSGPGWAVPTREQAPAAREPVRSEAVASSADSPAARASGSSRGRLVNEATLEPIPDALVATSLRNDWTDADGWFDTGDVLDGLDELMVVNVGTDSNIHEVPRERWIRLADGWQVPLAIGPTYLLRFSGVDGLPVPSRGCGQPGAAARGWEARLVREGGSEERWTSLRWGSLPYLRYGHPRSERPGRRCWIEARSLGGLFEGRGEVVSLVGVQEVDVVCRACPVLRGSVIDESGAPIGDVSIDALLVSGEPPEPLHASTGKDGSYQLSPREPGRMLVTYLAPSSTTTRKLRLDVSRGVTRAPDVVLERRSPAGDVRGRVSVRSDVEPVVGWLLLRALDGSGYEETRGFSVGGRRPLITGRRTGAGAVPIVPEPSRAKEFLFENVPAGRFELSAHTERGYPCSPRSVELVAPAEDVVFRLENTVGLRSYVLELVDADSGEAVTGIASGVLLDGGEWRSVGRQEEDQVLVELAEGVGFEWHVGSPRYRSERGTERDFVLQGESLVATRRLRRGFGVRLELRERTHGAEHLGSVHGTSTARGWSWKGSAVVGAEILADGEQVATSDEHGIAELDLSAEPDRIEVRLPGFRVLDSGGIKDGKVRSFPVAEVWLVRE